MEKIKISTAIEVVSRGWIQAAKDLVTPHIDTQAADELMRRKRKDYSVKPLLMCGVDGVRVRVISKLCRLENLIDKQAEFEKIEDTCLDIYNYCVIAEQLANGEL